MSRERSYLVPGQLPVSGVVTALPISLLVRVEEKGSRAIRVDILASGVTVAGSITAVVQTQVANMGWVNTKSVAITGNGQFTVKFLDLIAADQQYIPLPALMRVVLTTTNAGDMATISNLVVSQ